MSRSFDAADELAHLPRPSSAWTETWEMRLVDPTGVAVLIVVVRRPAEGRVSYVASVLGEGRLTTSVIEHDIVAPSGLELRASGIWADHVCETPFEHWSVGLEAFGLVFDDPDDAITTGHGHVTPVGFDLEWEDDAAPGALAGPDAGYVVGGRAHGEVLVGHEKLELDGVGSRLHRWGTGPRFVGWGRAVGDVVARSAAPDGSGGRVDWSLVRTGSSDSLHLSSVSEPRRAD